MVTLSLHIVVSIIIGTDLALIENEVVGICGLFVERFNWPFAAFRESLRTALPITVVVPAGLNMFRISLDTFASKERCERLGRL
ncbi:hypothetical protein C6A85_000000104935 [Mycobacterium sp. ITM-2017-0098]|nr:hypothetical protein C6A85_000000104935 [Mycobacterium sp. ITM-2017-0098]